MSTSESISSFKLDFAGVGAAKCGTTWLAQCLSEHPQICMARLKETNYFCTQHFYQRYRLLDSASALARSNHDRGIAWLQNRFRDCRPGQLLGEFSPVYFGDPTSPGLLFDHNRQMKLLFTFRNPTDALYASYFEIRRYFPLHETFESFIEKYPDSVDCFRFHGRVQRFLARFPREQVFFTVIDDAQADAQGVYRQICRFLSVEASFEPPSLRRRFNERTDVRSTWLRDALFAVRWVVNRSVFTGAVKVALVRLGAGRLGVALRKRNERPAQRVPMQPETRARLVATYREEVLRLGTLLGRDLSRWNA